MSPLPLVDLPQPEPSPRLRGCHIHSSDGCNTPLALLRAATAALGHDQAAGPARSCGDSSEGCGQTTADRCERGNSRGPGGVERCGIPDERRAHDATSGCEPGGSGCTGSAGDCVGRRVQHRRPAAAARGSAGRPGMDSGVHDARPWTHAAERDAAGAHHHTPGRRRSAHVRRCREFPAGCLSGTRDVPGRGKLGAERPRVARCPGCPYVRDRSRRRAGSAARRHRGACRIWRRGWWAASAAGARRGRACRCRGLGPAAAPHRFEA